MASQRVLEIKTTIFKSLPAHQTHIWGGGGHLGQNPIKSLWSDREKWLHINVLELKVVFLDLKRFKDQCQNQTVLVATDNPTVVAYIKTKTIPFGEGVCSPKETHDLVASPQNNPISQAHFKAPKWGD